MMFHKQYYRLEEAAQKLGVDVESILYDALKLKCLPSLKIQSNYGVIVRQNECSCLIDVINPENNIMHEENIELVKASYKRLESLILSYETISMIYHQGYARLANSDELRFGNEPVIDFEGKAEFFSAVPAERLYIYSISRKNKLTSEDLVIHHTELTRLLAIKAERDDKPTAEQLQQQLDEANARIAELEAKPIEQEKREQALLFWVEGVGRDVVMTMTKQQIHDSLKKIDPIFHIKDFDKFWQNQQVIKFKAGRRTR